jgi:hypothetical protein
LSFASALLAPLTHARSAAGVLSGELDARIFECPLNFLKRPDRHLRLADVHSSQPCPVIGLNRDLLFALLHTR